MKYLSFLLLLITLNSYAQPERKWATYYGDSTTTVIDMVYDKDRHCIYTIGTTVAEEGIATPGSFKDSIFNYLGIPPPLEPWNWIPDLYLVKWDTMGNRLWATYYGGSEKENTPSLTIDYSGNIYITSSSESNDNITTPGSYIESSYYDNIFIAKFSPEGNRIWSTFINDTIGASVNGAVLSMDEYNNLYIGSQTFASTGVATVGAHQENLTITLPYLTTDGCIMKFDSNGVKLWGTYYGGNGSDFVSAIHCDKSNNVYFGGRTSSDSGIATTGSDIDDIPIISEGTSVSFIVKMDNNGIRKWSTYLNCYSNTFLTSITSDENGNIYVYGFTESDTNIATIGSYQPLLSGVRNAFIIKYDSFGVKQWGTYYGGNILEMFFYEYLNHIITPDIAYSQENKSLYIVGQTNSTEGIADECSYPAVAQRGFMARFTTDGNKVWSSYIDASVYDIALGVNDNLFIIGKAFDSGIATSGAFKEDKAVGAFSPYIARFKDTIPCSDDMMILSYNDSVLSVPDTFSSYRWYIDGTLVASGTHSFSFNASTAGDYIYAVVQNACGCTFYTDSFDLSSFLSIKNNAIASLDIYPNPSHNGIFHFPKINRIEYALINVYDQSGKNVLSIPYQTEMDLSHFTDGIYYYQVNANGQNYSGKLVLKRKK